MTDDPFDEPAVAAAWDGNAELWADGVRAGYDIYRTLYTLPAFLDFIPPVENLKVIDLGCGEGTNTRRFAERGAAVTGVDLSTAMIARARADEDRAPLGIRYKVSSFARLEFAADSSFCAAVSTMAMMDGPDFAGAMRETHRVLAPGGWLCFSILHPCFMTPAHAWLKDATGAPDGIRAGRYFDRTPYLEHWTFSQNPDRETTTPFAVPRFPRTLSDYVNAVCEAGFRVTALEEPRPSEEAVKALESFAKWRQHAPMVLFLAARKA